MSLNLLIVSLVSGLLGALLSAWIFIRRERRRMKLDTLRELLGNKFRIGSPEFLKPLNEIFVVYNDSPAVLQRLETVLSNARKADPRRSSADVDDDFVRLLRAMCDSAGIKHREMTDNFMKSFFGANPQAAALQQALLARQQELARGATQSPPQARPAGGTNDP